MRLEEIMKINQLIGLGEVQRILYEELSAEKKLDKELGEAYRHHQEELELLIKYQRENNSSETDTNISP